MALALALFSFVPVAVSQTAGHTQHHPDGSSTVTLQTAIPWNRFPQMDQAQFGSPQMPYIDQVQYGYQQQMPTYIPFQQMPTYVPFQEPLINFGQFQQQYPDFSQMQFGFQDVLGQGSGSCGLAAEPDSECCLAQQANNPFSQGSQLSPGKVYCGQASDTKWWNVEVTKQNCDGSYAVVVQDDVKTEWPSAQRSMMLDQSCDDFYNAALKESGIEVPAPAHLDPGARPRLPRALAPAPEGVEDTPSAPAPEGGEVTPSKEEPTANVPVAPSAKVAKVPWKALSAAGALGAMPLVYHLTSAGAA